MGCKFCKTVPELAVAKGDIISYDSGGVPVKLTIGANDTILVADSAEASGLKYITLPKRVTIWGDEMLVTNGNALLHTFDSAQRYQTRSAQNTSADGDVRTTGFWLRGGTYNFHTLGFTNSARGKCDWSIDGDAAFATGQDWYSAGNVQNVVKSVASVTITSGWHILKMTVNGKNVSSSSYIIDITKCWFETGTD